jgi:hypothetical protein
MGKSPVQAGTPTDVQVHPGLPDPPRPTARFRSAPYLDGSDGVLLPGEVYAASLEDAARLWKATLEDALEGSFSVDSWIPDLQGSYRRLRGYSLARKAAGALDLLLRPVRGLLSCPAPFQSRLLRGSLERAFQEAARFVMIRDLGRAVDAGAIAALRPIRRSLPELIASGRFGPGKLTAEDHRRALRTLEDFSGYVGRWLPSDAGPVAAALRNPRAVEWLFDHVTEVIATVPETLLSRGVFGKICRSLFGVLAFKISHLPEDLSQARLDEEIFESVQAGFHFGRTYLFDEIMDLDGFPREERNRFFGAVMDQLSGKPVADPPSDPSARLVLESLQAFPTLFGEAHARSIYHAYLALAHSQIQDARKSFAAAYSEEEVYAPLMVKSAYTRILPALLGRLRITSDFLAHSYLVALPNQLIDDLRDLSDDQAASAFTPYTYFVRAGSGNPDFRHPLSVYLHALDFVARKLGGDPEIRRLWISRFVSALRVFEFKGGRGALSRFLSAHPCGGREFERILLDLADFADLVLDPEALLASLASATSMYVRGLEAAPVAGH